jgi:ABC-type Fe3+/spermidine/putrescine transport system ATPase subunit
VRNIWSGRVIRHTESGIEIDTGRMTLRARALDVPVGEVVDVCIRPERVMLLRPDRRPGDGARDTLVTAEIVDEIAHGASHTIFFRLAGEPPTDGFDVEVELASHPYDVMGVARQRTWTLAFPRDAVHVMRRGA